MHKTDIIICYKSFPYILVISENGNRFFHKGTNPKYIKQVFTFKTLYSFTIYIIYLFAFINELKYLAKSKSVK